MPPLSILYVRTAFLHLVLGMTVGALMLANKGVAFAAWLWRLRSAHAEILLVGWLIQFGFGVAFWIAPRFWEKPVRGNVFGARLAFVLLNGGIWLVTIATFLELSAIYVLLGRLLEIGAAIAFAWHLWPRIVSREG